MREVVIISGKGGTGKTSLAAAFAHLAERKVICDLDVDAPDLHILLDPKPMRTEEFFPAMKLSLTLTPAQDAASVHPCADTKQSRPPERQTKTCTMWHPCAAKAVPCAWHFVRNRPLPFHPVIAAPGTTAPHALET